jgi:hypothetical protein
VVFVIENPCISYCSNYTSLPDASCHFRKISFRSVKRLDTPDDRAQSSVGEGGVVSHQWHDAGDVSVISNMTPVMCQWSVTWRRSGVSHQLHDAGGVSVISDMSPVGCQSSVTWRRWSVSHQWLDAGGVSVISDMTPVGCQSSVTWRRWGVSHEWRDAATWRVTSPWNRWLDLLYSCLMILSQLHWLCRDSWRQICVLKS